MSVRSYFRKVRFSRADAPSNSPVEIVAEHNDDWKKFHRRRSISIKQRPLFSPRDKFFTIGSCFAAEVRKTLTARGLSCLPDYRSIKFDRDNAAIDTLPDREHMNYYNTFSIRQEFERAAGEWTQARDDVWEVPLVIARGKIRRGGVGTIWQDPYRRLTFGSTKSVLNATLESINSVMAEGIRKANAFIITLGLTEVFVKNDNGLVACQFPGYGRGGGMDTTTFRATSYEENLFNMERTVELIGRLNPDAKVVITVSPVPLRLTFTGDDIVVANQRSKSTLLAVAHEVCRRHSRCVYFPSYEIAMMAGREAFQERDGLHVEPELVKTIMEAFSSAHLSDGN